MIELRGITVVHWTRVLWYRESDYNDAVIHNEWNSRNNHRQRVRCAVERQSLRFYYNRVCPHKPIGVRVLQLSNFAPVLPSVYIWTDAEYIPQSWNFVEIICSAELMDEQRVLRTTQRSDCWKESRYAQNTSFVMLHYICRSIYHLLYPVLSGISTYRVSIVPVNFPRSSRLVKEKIA